MDHFLPIAIAIYKQGLYARIGAILYYPKECSPKKKTSLYKINAPFVTLRIQK